MYIVHEQNKEKPEKKERNGFYVQQLASEARLNNEKVSNEFKKISVVDFD